MADLEARFRVRLEGKEDLSEFLRKSQNDAKEFNRVVSAAFKDTGREIASFGAQTAKSLASLAVGNVGIANQAKSVLDFRDSVTKLAITAQLGADKVDELRDQIHSVSMASNQMQTDVEEALSAFVARTGDVVTARKNLELYGKVATATGASIKDVALIGVELSEKLNIKSPAEQRQALAILTAQGKSGAIEIKDLATRAPAMFSAASAMFGVGGIEGLRGTGALAQVFAHSFGGKATAGMTETAVRKTFTDLQRRKGYVDHLLGHNTKGEDPYEVIKELIVKTGGDTESLLRNRSAGIFTPTALRGVGELAKEFRATGGFGSFDKFKNVSGDFSAVESDFAMARSTGASALKASQISVAASSDKNLGDKFDYLAQNADKLAKVFDFATSHLALTASIMVAGLLAKNLGGGLIGYAARGGQFGVQQVFVTGAAPGVLGAGGPSGAAASGTAMGKAFSVVAAASIGYAIGTIIDQSLGLSDGISGALVKARQKTLDGEADRALDSRAEGVRFYERKGQTHARAITSQLGVESMQHVLERLNKQINQININIVNDRVASVEDNGTRSTAALTRRGMDVGERAAP